MSFFVCDSSVGFISRCVTAVPDVIGKVSLLGLVASCYISLLGKLLVSVFTARSRMTRISEVTQLCWISSSPSETIRFVVDHHSQGWL